jgi:hypothetical protein
MLGIVAYILAGLLLEPVTGLVTVVEGSGGGLSPAGKLRVDP